MSLDRFHALPHRSLAAAGLGRGGVDVDYGTGGLALYGMGDERLAVPWSTIGKVRIGFSSSRYSKPLYRMTLWTSAASRPLRLTSLHRDEPAFAAMARTVALRTLRARGTGSVEGGLDWWDALLLPLGFAAMMVLATLAVIADTRHPKPSDALNTALAMLGITLAIEVVFLVISVRPMRPRAVARVDELERFLPGG